MMATVTLDITQSGSGSTEIHAQIGDTITLQLNETVESNLLDQAADQLNSILGPPTGVIFAFSNAGGASTILRAAQSGSGTTTINAAAGDTLTFVLNETVESNVLDQATATLNDILSQPTGVIFAFSNAGTAS
jgi:hypothetical protein